MDFDPTGGIGPVADQRSVRALEESHLGCESEVGSGVPKSSDFQAAGSWTGRTRVAGGRQAESSSGTAHGQKLTV